MTDEYEKEDDEEYDDEEATSGSEEEYEDEAEDADASDESEESESEDSVASWGYEEKKSRFSKEMLAGFAAIAVLLTVFGVVSYKKMTGIGDSKDVATAPPASLGSPDGSDGDPEGSGSSPAQNPNDPFTNDAENRFVAGEFGPQSEPGFVEETSNASLGGGEPGDPNLTNGGSTDFVSNGTSSETASLFPNDGSSGPGTPIDPFGSNSSLSTDDPFATNSETETLFPNQPDPGLGSETPFGSSTASNEFDSRPTGLPATQPDTFQPNGFSTDRGNVLGGASSEFADSTRTDPFGAPDLSGGTGSASSRDMPNGTDSAGTGSNDPFLRDNQLAQNEPTNDGSLENSFSGDPGSVGNTVSNDPFGGSSDSSLTNEPFGSNAGSTSEPTGLFDRGSATSIDNGSLNGDGGLNDPASTGLPIDSGFANDRLGSEVGRSQPPGTSSGFESGTSASSATPFGNEEPFGTSSTGSTESTFGTPVGNGFESGSGEPADLFPGGNSQPVGTAANEPFQPPITSSPDSSFPNSSASSISSGPFGNESFNAGSSASTSTFASQPANSGTYTIQDGDSYWNISKKVYGTAKYFQVLADHNRRTIVDPQKMKAGVSIETPPASLLQSKLKTVRRTALPELAGRIETSGQASNAGSAASRGSSSSTTESVVVSRPPTKPDQPSGLVFNSQRYPMFRIGETDTLTSIASNHLGRASRWQQIYNMNRDQLQSPDKLEIGMLLKLPADASRVPLVDRTSSLR